HLPEHRSDLQRLLIAEFGEHLGKVVIELGVAIFDGNRNLQDLLRTEGDKATWHGVLREHGSGEILTTNTRHGRKLSGKKRVGSRNGNQRATVGCSDIGAFCLARSASILAIVRFNQCLTFSRSSSSV